MKDIFSTAQDCVVAPSRYLTRVDRWDAIALVTGLVLMTVFRSYFNRKYGR